MSGSATGQLSCEVWDDFLKFLGCPVNTGPDVKEAMEGEHIMEPKVFPSVPHVSHNTLVILFFRNIDKRFEADVGP